VEFSVELGESYCIEKIGVLFAEKSETRTKEEMFSH
jgi:hypothetical protein